ncbi:hypothetical protein TRFO_18949 [Tritrichomonas foetus]|uniref:Uncharacterized protein n=1 Tax=Tritrichomonas foetus TaxID=1144522 RepID=A0A1J4KQ74_9EUKA|nr:hypothetical protein TRFO_18949 [Tritrichomonas foetus]|eukprot:OHT11581.1 hypothetical protein TRFO_18949 [Tritrichomonas foetus]
MSKFECGYFSIIKVAIHFSIMKKIPFFPKFSTKKDSKANDPSNQIILYLKENSKWISKGAMVGTKSESDVFIKKSKGPQKFILFHQNNDNSFIFPLIDAVSQFFCRKMIILSLSKENNIISPSAHFWVFKLHQVSIDFEKLKLYSIFPRLSASSRKEIQQPEKSQNSQDIKKNLEENVSKHIIKGYSQMLQDSQNFGPKESMTFDFTQVFPITQLVKIPDDHKTPKNFAFSIKGVNSLKPLRNNYTCVPVNLKCLISVSNARVLNTYANHLDT